ncbi:MAG: rhamnulokinase [Streptomycetaceae bacterium]|nr:MAG: rhamnulokinase [Streptomycetaceae bacterium]
MSDFLAVDLGATSARVAIGRVRNGRIELEIAHRFTHEVTSADDGSIFWNWELIVAEVLKGLKIALRISQPISLAIDGWAVDYGFISPQGAVLTPIHAYRDPRTEIPFAELTHRIGKERIYSSTGIQFLPFNTIYQLNSAIGSDQYESAQSFLLLPDLFNYILTGVQSTEITNASTTQLLRSATRAWDTGLIGQAGLRSEIFTKLHEAGTVIGPVRGHDELDGIKVVAIASHDTAAAIAGIPFRHRESEGYISSGTWSLVGIESEVPYISEDSQDANLTNELGVYNTVRLLKNVTGMWLLEECRRTWKSEGHDYSMPELLSLAQENLNFPTLINPNDPCFTLPGSMTTRITDYCLERSLQPPLTPGQFAATILKSLAIACRDTVGHIESVTGRKLDTLHILGGGSQITLLNQLTANACQVTVKTGPVEATLFGNIAVQAISAGIISDIAVARAMIADSFESIEFNPEH